jgi:hypothetical protein
MENVVIETSVFADCASDAIVIRAPYKSIIDMIKSMEDDTVKDELVAKLQVAIRRSKKIKDYYELGQENT